MRHVHGYRKLGRTKSHRYALLRNMVTSLVIHERIETTLEKAKEVRSLVEKYITVGKKNSLHARRQIASFLFDKDAAKKVCDDLSKRFAERAGGYTRILKKGIRFGDGAKIAILELVDFRDPKAEPAEKKAKKAAKEPKEVKASSKSKKAPLK